MSKFKNFKIEFKHLLTAASAIGMVAGFIAALFSKKKATACVAFFASFAGLVAGVGMETGLLNEPECCKKIEVEIGDDEDDDWGNPFGDDDEDFGFETEEEEQPEEKPVADEEKGETPEEPAE